MREQGSRKGISKGQEYVLDLPEIGGLWELEVLAGMLQIPEPE